MSKRVRIVVATIAVVAALLLALSSLSSLRTLTANTASGNQFDTTSEDASAAQSSQNKAPDGELPGPSAEAPSTPDTSAAIADPAVAGPATDQNTPTTRFIVSTDGSDSASAKITQTLDAVRVTDLGNNSFAVETPATTTAADAEQVLAAAGAFSVQPDALLYVTGTPNDPSFGSQWGLTTINAPTAWDSNDGTGEIIAVLDTGTDREHADLAANMWTNPGETLNGIDDDNNGYIDDIGGWNFWGNYKGDPGSDNGDVFDDDNPNDDAHGTHVSGIAAAVTNNGIGGAGTAKGATVMPLKFIGPDGGYTSDAILGLQYAVDNGATAVNMSFGGPSYVAAFEQAIIDAGNDGVTVAVAAGNDADNIDVDKTYPASFSAPTNMLVVAATTSSSGLSYFSNYGSSNVDVGAPGSGIYSTTPNETYGSWSGTSMATPFVSGVLAQVAAADPSLTPSEIRTQILGSVVPAAALAGKSVSGGILDAQAALPAGNPTAALIATPPSGKAPLTTTLDASGSTDSDGTIVQYSFDYENDGTPDQVGASATASPPQYAEGSYTASVTVTDNNGLTDTATTTVTSTNQAPIVSLAADPTSGKAGPNPLSVNLTATASDPDGDGIATYDWDFDNDGVDDVVGGTATQATTYGVGNHTAKVTVTDGAGASTTATASITGIANQAPIVSLVADPPSGRADPDPLDVTLTATASDPDGDGIGTNAYDWDFDNDGIDDVVGGTATQATTYGVGNHTAKVTVTDNDGKPGSTTVSIVGNANQPPTVVLTATPPSGKADPDPLTVTLDASGSTDPDGDGIATYDWDFDNDGVNDVVGGTATQNRDYGVGNHTAKVKVTDAAGLASTETVEVHALSNEARGIAAWRPSSGMWYFQAGSEPHTRWGISTDIPVEGDYDGDGTIDIAVYRPSTGWWYFQDGSRAHTQWGTPGDIPLPGDYNGDGSTDIAVYRPATGKWLFEGGVRAHTQWGISTDTPVPGDYNGDGTTDIAVYRGYSGRWLFEGGVRAHAQWGISTDTPVPGDYNGDDTTDIAVYRGYSGRWLFEGGVRAHAQWGISTDIPVPADWNNDNSVDIAVYRPSSGVWYFQGGEQANTQWGAPGDMPMRMSYPD